MLFVNRLAEKSLPVHCVVETLYSLEEDRESWRRKAHVETDSYVIIPVKTAVHELLVVALTRLGYPKETAASAKGQYLFSYDQVQNGEEEAKVVTFSLNL